ncbi:ORC1-type DNA replication protein 1 [Candidatus Gugararchaeum adminiculabundum]|nr:ORC1-type DNA replication protein 1 [Candidatus Gugararchaeum adminiculabundum]
MSELFKNRGDHAEPAILRKEEVLLAQYAPPEVLHREGELNEIAESIKPLTEGKPCKNIFVCGRSGTGKTTSMKYALSQLKDFSSRVIPVYVNCWETYTQMSVYSKIAEALELAIPRRGLATDEVFSQIIEKLVKEKLSVLIALDEFDSLAYRNEFELLYSLARANEKREGLFGIIGVSADSALLSKFDERVKTSLRMSSLEFKEYTVQQLEDILNERAKLAFAPGTCPKSVINSCALAAKENGSNVRLALEVLWRAANIAENRKAKSINQKDVSEGLEAVKHSLKKTKEPLEKLPFNLSELSPTTEEKWLLEIVKKAGGEATFSDLYAEFAKKAERTKRQIRNYVRLLEAKKILEVFDVEVPGWQAPAIAPKAVRFLGLKK